MYMCVLGVLKCMCVKIYIYVMYVNVCVHMCSFLYLSLTWYSLMKCVVVALVVDKDRQSRDRLTSKQQRGTQFRKNLTEEERKKDEEKTKKKKKIKTNQSPAPSLCSHP